jgi:hypothetical protein
MTDVSDKLDEYAVYVARKATDEFKPSNVVNIPGISDRRAKRMISSTIESLRSGQEKALKQQYGAVVGSVHDDSIDNHLDDYVHYDAFYRNYEGSREQQFRDALADRMRSMQEALSPIVTADAEDFWDATREAYGRDEAVEQLRKLFTASETAWGFSDGIVMEVTVPLRRKTYTYTEESIRALEVGEKYAKKKVEMDAEEAY